MWRFKQLVPREQVGLEGKAIDVGNLRLLIKNVIAQGGFSVVYLGKCIQTGRIYAVKHIICSDKETESIIRKEITIMDSLKGHPNVVTLHAHSSFESGRTKEFYLALEYCEKMLVDVIEARGGTPFEEAQLAKIFRDICNAVYALHMQSPPVAHRDLKAENILLATSSGSWKLCDFGSCSTNFKRFERPEEMGIEEDNIRKHTTPAYRAPEMWDLYMREIINEKVDIWALGCLLYRMAYFKSCFDGDSKLQVLNGKYKIPEAPKYSSDVIALIKNMLAQKPSDRPDILTVWKRVNDLSTENRRGQPDLAPRSRDPQARPAMIGRGVAGGVPTNGPHSTPQSPKSGTSGSFWASSYAPQAASKETLVAASSQAVFSHDTPGSQTSTKREAKGPSGMYELGQLQFGQGQAELTPMRQLVRGVAVPSVTSQNLSKLPAWQPFGSEEEQRGNLVLGGDSGVAGEAADGLAEVVARLQEELRRMAAARDELEERCAKLTALTVSQRQEIQDLRAVVVANQRTDGILPLGEEGAQISDLSSWPGKGLGSGGPGRDSSSLPSTPTVSSPPGEDRLMLNISEAVLATDTLAKTASRLPAKGTDSKGSKPYLWLDPNAVGNPIKLTFPEGSLPRSPGSPEMRPERQASPRMQVEQNQSPMGQDIEHVSPGRSWHAFADHVSDKPFAGSLSSRLLQEPTRSPPQIPGNDGSLDSRSQKDTIGFGDGSFMVQQKSLGFQGFSGTLKDAHSTSSFPPGIWDPNKNQQQHSEKVNSHTSKNQPAGWAAF